MNIITIPLRNMRRKSGRTLLLLLVATLGVMSIVALYQVSLVVGRSLEEKLSSFGANIMITPATEKLSVSYGGFHMGDMLYDIQYLKEKKTVEAIRAIELKDRISVVAPKLVTMLKLDDIAVALVGVRWKQERGIKSYWATEGFFPEQPNEILLGSLAAAKLEYGVGDTVHLYGSEFRISGVLYETGGDDDSVIFMDLGGLQSLLDRPDGLSFIEVAALCAGCPIEDIVTQIQSALPGVTVTALQNVVNQRMASVHFVQKLALGISLVILVTAASMVGLSMLSAVNERKKDIGILRTLGFAQSRIFTIFCLEAAFIGLLAGFVGYFTGYGAGIKALEFLNMESTLEPSFSIEQLLIACLTFGLVTVLSSLYPAWKGARIDPSDALTAL